MRCILLFLFISFLPVTGYSQENYIEWKKDGKIKWTDFKGQADVNSPYAALSAIGVHYKYNSVSTQTEHKLTFEISARFEKTKSWSRRRLETPYTLRHEQLHFDIAEVVSRIFRMEVENTIFTKDYKNETINIFDKYMKYLQKLQQKYDDETQHSRNKARQKEWERFIDKELKK